MKRPFFFVKCTVFIFILRSRHILQLSRFGIRIQPVSYTHLDVYKRQLIELAKFYEVTVDYLLGRSQTRNHPNADLADLHLSDDMIELLKSGLRCV